MDFVFTRSPLRRSSEQTERAPSRSRRRSLLCFSPRKSPSQAATPPTGYRSAVCIQLLSDLPSGHSHSIVDSIKRHAETHPAVMLLPDDLAAAGGHRARQPRQQRPGHHHMGLRLLRVGECRLASLPAGQVAVVATSFQTSWLPHTSCYPSLGHKHPNSRAQHTHTNTQARHNKDLSGEN